MNCCSEWKENLVLRVLGIKKKFSTSSVTHPKTWSVWKQPAARHFSSVFSERP